MAEYILQILRSQLMVVFSWGFHRPTALPDNRGLAFQVEAFKYTETVKVIYNEGTDLFEVHLEDVSFPDFSRRFFASLAELVYTFFFAILERFTYSPISCCLA